MIILIIQHQSAMAGAIFIPNFKEAQLLKRQDLIVWLLDGSTMKFENVREFVCIEPPSRECIEFMYDGVSTEKTRKATFFVKDIMGYALSNERTVIQANERE